MKWLKWSCALVLALLVSMPACAQEPSDTAVKAIITKFFEAFNSGNVDQTAALWSPDAVDINVNGMVSGKTQMHARIAAELKTGLKLDHTIERVQVGENGVGCWTVHGHDTRKGWGKHGNPWRLASSAKTGQRFLENTSGKLYAL